MNINLTLFGQALTFAIFVWFTMRYVMPPVNQALDERAKTIADGLAAAEKGQQKLQDAKEQCNTMLKKAKDTSKGMVDDADKRAQAMVQQAKDKASVEKARILDAADKELACNIKAAHEALTEEVAQLALNAAEKILQKKFTAKASEAMIDDLIAEG